MWISASNNLSLGLFWEYKRARYLKTAKYDQGLQSIFDKVDDNVMFQARANPNLNSLELERLTLLSFQNYVDNNVDGISVSDGRYSMRMKNGRASSSDWVATPILDKDIPTIVESLPPSLLANSGQSAISPSSVAPISPSPK
jgi:hypothetical protein